MTELASHFKGIAVKRLRNVEINPKKSNQHEFNGVQSLKCFLGHDKKTIKANFIYLALNEEDRLSQESTLTWYDSRKNNPGRSAEFRLYYTANEVIHTANVGDVLVAALRPDRSMLLIVIPADSSQLAEVLWFFGMTQDPGDSFVTIDAGKVAPQSQALFNYVAENAGIEVEEKTPKNDWLDLMLERFGGPVFPKTRELSGLALETLAQDIDPINTPDQALISLIDREEMLFRQLEKHIIQNHLGEQAKAWQNDVDAFIQFSLSVHNRRKSRAGHALENHLEWIFQKNSISYQRNGHTEGRSKPDFLFPNSAKYKDLTWPESQLMMLGVKTTCKDRWRQVLNEARRIPEKHLLTLQPGISKYQTEEMTTAKLTLVLPKTLHTTYSAEQQGYLMSLEEFMLLLHEQQAHTN